VTRARQLPWCTALPACHFPAWLHFPGACSTIPLAPAARLPWFRHQWTTHWCICSRLLLPAELSSRLGPCRDKHYPLDVARTLHSAGVLTGRRAPTGCGRYTILRTRCRRRAAAAEGRARNSRERVSGLCYFTLLRRIRRWPYHDRGTAGMPGGRADVACCYNTSRGGGQLWRGRGCYAYACYRRTPLSSGSRSLLKDILEPTGCL